MAKRRFHINFYAVLILIGSFLFGFAVSTVFGFYTLPHEQIIGSVLTPLETAASDVGYAVGDFFASFGRYRDVKAENERLSSELAEARLRLDESYYLSYENDQLRKLLSLQKDIPSFSLAEAQVVSRSTDGWAGKLTLNAGSASGIERGDIVITGDGLVGVVDGVGLNWSSVLCLVDPSFSAGALFVRTGEAGYTEGTVALHARGLFRAGPLRTDSFVNVGDTLVTSGLGGRFPKGLVIGTVEELSAEPDALTVYAAVRPAVDFDAVRTVYVVTDFTSEGPAS